METGQVRSLEVFEGAKHIDPQFSPDGSSLYFVSDPGGFSDIYRFDLTTDQVFQVTTLARGVSGLTELSSATSVASQTGRVAFSAAGSWSGSWWSEAAPSTDSERVSRRPQLRQRRRVRR